MAAGTVKPRGDPRMGSLDLSLGLCAKLAYEQLGDVNRRWWWSMRIYTERSAAFWPELHSAAGSL